MLAIGLGGIWVEALADTLLLTSMPPPSPTVSLTVLRSKVVVRTVVEPSATRPQIPTVVLVPIFLNRSLETGASCPLSVVQYLVVRGNLPASLRRRAANYQRIKTRVCRLSCARVWYCCGHLSSANVLPWPHGGC